MIELKGKSVVIDLDEEKLVVRLDLKEPDPELAAVMEPVIDYALYQLEKLIEREERRLELLAKIKAILRMAGAL